MESLRGWLEEYMLAEVGYTPAEVIDTRITALREMMTNWRSMSVAQFQEVMTTAHFSSYFADALSRSFMKDYDYMTGDWKNYTFADTVPDFRDVDRFRMTEPGGLVLRRELKDHQETSIAESIISYGVEEYSRSFTVSWQTIMNDDLGKIRETPTRMARAAARWADAWVSALYDNAVTQNSLTALGLTYGGTGRLTALNLAVGLNAMMQHQDTLGNPLNIAKVHLIIPPILRIQADTIIKSTLVAGLATNDINVLPGYLAGYWVDPYITTTAASVPWYLIADPSDIPVVTVARLAGWGGPAVFQKTSDISVISGSVPAPFLLGNADHGAIMYFVEDIIGGWDNDDYVGVTDFHGIYFSDGTAP